MFKTSTSLACIVYYDAYKVLKSYTVTVNGSATTTMTNQTVSTYTFNNSTKTLKNYEVTNTKPATPGDVTGKIKNVQGTELPSTGGMGTTILYIGGSILVILAAVLLITKRRMNAEA